MQLIDMGFTREQALEALTNTTTLEQATDYILTHSIPSTVGVAKKSELFGVLLTNLIVCCSVKAFCNIYQSWEAGKKIGDINGLIFSLDCIKS